MPPNIKELYTPGRFRIHRIIVEDTEFYVNGHCLAEISEFFASAFFGSFKETETGTLHLQDGVLEDFQSFLAVILPQYGEPVTVDNFQLMAYYADMWEIECLKKKCSAFLDFDLQSTWLPLDKAVDILEVALIFGYRKHTNSLVAYLASFDSKTMQALDFEERIEDKVIVETVLSMPATQHRGTHRFNQCISDYPMKLSVINKDNSSKIKTKSTCSLYGCSLLIFSECRNCSLQFCEIHEDAVKCLRPEKMYSNTLAKEDTRSQVKVIPFRTNYVDINADKLTGE